MTPLREAVHAALSADGELAVIDPNYVERAVQL